MTVALRDDLPRPGFADELLARLERDRGRRIPAVLTKGVLAGAAAASLALLVARGRRAR